MFSATDPLTYCAMANAGYDFIWTEMQHNDRDWSQAARMWRTCPHAKAVPGARIAYADEREIQRATDAGALVIVVSWLVLLGNHAIQSYSVGDPPPLVDLGTDSTRDAELTQRGVFYRGSRIGYIRERFTPLENGFRAEQTGELTLNLLGRERRVRMEGSAESGVASVPTTSAWP